MAVFIFFFSLIFQQSQHILLFFAITGAIFAGGSGAVIIGGLYWKRGTAAAAWAAMITGSSIAVGGIIIHQLKADFFINGQMFWAIGMFASSLIFVLVSLLGKRRVHDMDRLLHRNRFAIEGETKVVEKVPSRGWKILGMGKEFTRFDKFIYIANYIWTGGWTIVFIIGTVYNLSHEVSNEAWMAFWKYYMYIQLGLAIIVIFWFTIGGFKDIKVMVHRLRTMKRDDSDDGFVSRERLETD